MKAFTTTLLNNRAWVPYVPAPNEPFIEFRYTMDNYIHFFVFMRSDNSMVFRVWHRSLAKGYGFFAPFMFRFGTLRMIISATNSWSSSQEMKEGVTYQNIDYNYWISKGIFTLPSYTVHFLQGNHIGGWGYNDLYIPKEFIPPYSHNLNRKLGWYTHHRQSLDFKGDNIFRPNSTYIGTFGIHDTAGGQQHNTTSYYSWM